MKSAVNWDEEAVALDYRVSPDNQRVMALVFENDKLTKWRIISRDFTSFVTEFGLQPAFD